ncbi:hypothetical protein M0R45_031779 [Rubus argutus]|uniref:Uncharacterized protein n=1 Tax=Rubus argutus TaxID=59490 RepID=A0AAW1WFA4_RUBAR
MKTKKMMANLACNWKKKKKNEDDDPFASPLELGGDSWAGLKQFPWNLQSSSLASNMSKYGDHKVYSQLVAMGGDLLMMIKKEDHDDFGSDVQPSEEEE